MADKAWALKGHKDDSTRLNIKHQGHFKSLLDFCIDVRDKELEKHLEICRKNASYMSKMTQDELLQCMKEYMQQQIIKEVES